MEEFNHKIFAETNFYLSENEIGTGTPITMPAGTPVRLLDPTLNLWIAAAPESVVESDRVFATLQSNEILAIERRDYLTWFSQNRPDFFEGNPLNEWFEVPQFPNDRAFYFHRGGMHLETRRAGCDRGRFICHADILGPSPAGWPRYFFDEEAAKKEIAIYLERLAEADRSPNDWNYYRADKFDAPQPEMTALIWFHDSDLCLVLLRKVEHLYLAGDYVAIAHSNSDLFHLDESDEFPRFYFDRAVALSEIQQWAQTRALTLQSWSEHDYSPALEEQAGDYPEHWNGKVPRRVKMLETVQSNVPTSYPLVAQAGKTYEAWVNSHGAVAACVTVPVLRFAIPSNQTKGKYYETKQLGLKPGEFEILSWW